MTSSKVKTMKVRFDVSLPRILNSQNAMPINEVLVLLEQDEDIHAKFKVDMEKLEAKQIIPFNELAQSITALQVAPIKRNRDDGEPILLQNGNQIPIPFTKKHHKMNASILKALYAALDKAEEATGLTITSMRDPIDVVLPLAEVKYLAIRIDRICKEFTTTGPHVPAYYEKWAGYKEKATTMEEAVDAEASGEAAN